MTNKEYSDLYDKLTKDKESDISNKVLLERLLEENKELKKEVEVMEEVADV